MMRVLKNRDFALLWWGGLVSMLGNWMLFVALPVYVYQATDSTLATSLMFIAGAVPRVLLGSVAGVFVDRFERKRTMVVCNLLLAATIAPLLLVTHSGAFWIIYVVAVLQSAIGQFVGPAENALLPALVGREDLTPANALNALNNNLARLIGPAVGGLVVARFGLSGVVIFDLASYLVAALLVALITASSGFTDKREPTAQRSAFGDLFQEWLEGLAQVRRSRVVAVLLAAMTLTSLGEGTFSVLLAPFVSVAFAGGALELGWVLSAQAVGGITGGVLIGWLGSRLPPSRLFGIGLLFIGLIDLAIFNYPAFFPNIVPALALMAVVGVPAAAAGAGYTTLMQTNVADRFLGRVFGTVGTVSALAMLLGMAMAGVLGDLVGVVAVINVQGVAYTLAGLLTLILLNPRRAPATSPEEASSPPA
jgi:MFS family permease